MIIGKIVGGQTEWFRAIIEKYQLYLYHIVHSVLHHQKDAEDVTQEALIAIYYSLPQYQSQGFKTWITRIAVNRAIDYKRKHQRRKENITDFLDENMLGAGKEDALETALIENETKEFVAASLNGIPPNYRDVMHAYYIEEKTYREIAEEQGLEIKSIESKLYRAKTWIRKHWREDDFR